MASSISSVTGTTSTTSTDSSTLSSDDFLQIMIAELQNQDPLDPMDNTEYVTQLAQLTTTEKLSDLVDLTEQSIEMNYYLVQSIDNTLVSTLIGQDAKYEGNTLNNTGDKDSVDFSYDLPSNADSVKVTVYDSNGNAVYEYDDCADDMGEHKLSWDFTDNDGNKLDEGEYTFEVEALDDDGEALDVTSYVFGSITGVRFTDEGTVIMVDDYGVDLSSIVEVQDPSGDKEE